MVVGTILSVFLVPVFFLVVRSIFKGGKREQEMAQQHARSAGVGQGQPVEPTL